MALGKTILVLTCLFCGSFGQNDVIDIQDVVSMLLEEQGITLDSLQSQLLLDDAGITLGSFDDDSDDVIKLELAESELVGGCSHGDCNYCVKAFKFKLCLEAKLIKLGFDLKISVNNKVIYHKAISVANPPPICLHAPFIGEACIRIYKVDISKRSACVGLRFQVHIGPIKKHVDVKIACFHIGKHSDAPLLFKQMLQELAYRNQMK